MRATMVRLFAALVALSAQAAAQGVDWTLASQRTQVGPGESLVLTVIAPPGEPLPDELPLTVRAALAEVTLALRALEPAVGGRRRYATSLPATIAGTATLRLADRPSNALAIAVGRKDAVQALLGEAGSPITEEEPIYFVVGTRGGASARFQLSFKYRLFDLHSGFGRAQPWLSGFYLGYTQNSVWDLSSRSKPFRDTSYRPSLYWRWERTDEKTWVDGARAGVEHESNGRDEPFSRSVDTVFVRPEWLWQRGEHRLEFTPKFYGYVDKRENPDIHRYRGHVDWRLRYDGGGQWIATAVLRRGTSGKASVLLDLSRRTRDFRIGPVSGYLHLQFFAGYGESILDYDVRRKSQLRLGFAIVP